MIILNCTLLNFMHVGILHPIFERYSNDFEYTTYGIFRRIVPPDCPKCGKSGMDSRVMDLLHADNGSWVDVVGGEYGYHWIVRQCRTKVKKFHFLDF